MISHPTDGIICVSAHASAPTTPPISTSPPAVPSTNPLPTSTSSTPPPPHLPSKFDQQLLLHPHIKFPPALNSPPSPCETPPPLSPAVSFRELRNEFAQLQQNHEHLLQRVARLEDLFLELSKILTADLGGNAHLGYPSNQPAGPAARQTASHTAS